MPKEKHEKPGLLGGAWKVFMNDKHQLAAQAFAYGREREKNVLGVST